MGYVQTDLAPTGTSIRKPWSTIDKSLRDKVDGIMVLKLSFTAADLELFPRLKVYVNMTESVHFGNSTCFLVHVLTLDTVLYEWE